MSINQIHVCDALQQTREQVTQAYFEIWTIEVGIVVKNNLYVDFEIFFFFFHIPYYVFYYLHVISEWFSNIFSPKIMHFLQHVKSKTIEMGNCKMPISQNHTSRKKKKKKKGLIHKWSYLKK